MEQILVGDDPAMWDVQPDQNMIATPEAPESEVASEVVALHGLRRALTDYGLTISETEVLEHIAFGRSNVEIGALRNTSESTVKTQVKSIFGKIDVNNRTQAISTAYGLQGKPASTQQESFGLTDHETEVVALVAEGCSDKEIAEILGYAKPTIKDHMKKIFEKVGTRDRTHVVSILYGLVDPVLTADSSHS